MGLFGSKPMIEEEQQQVDGSDQVVPTQKEMTQEELVEEHERIVQALQSYQFPMKPPTPELKLGYSIADFEEIYGKSS